MMSSSRAEAFLGLPDWARRITAQVEVSFHESLSGTWQPEGGGYDARVTLELTSAAPSAQTLLDSGDMRASGTVQVQGLVRTAEVVGERHVSWDSGRIELRLRFTGDDGRPYRLVGGWSPARFPGGEREPFRLRLETGDGETAGDAVLFTAEPAAAAAAR
jgi:hypothetical protein